MVHLRFVGRFPLAAARGQNMPSPEWQALSPDAAAPKKKYPQGDSRATTTLLGRPFDPVFPHAWKTAIRRRIS
ncbi:hypothetical protein [Rhizobium sp. N941]|uniref:hypothetical protein n=1 Tax=Rhizobium sp. N941 TaxID=1703971 RepID=UPI00117A4EE6|nr:hypothetical protein [Rhizobium sp. N941]